MCVGRWRDICFSGRFRHYGRQLNIILALLLVYCAVRIFY
ncbi:Transporter LysE family [Salmonella enterica subsp. enterica]|nr:Transporter LysE family [Salmonella enterica subsp. enterica]